MKDILLNRASVETVPAEPDHEAQWPRLVETTSSPSDDAKESEQQHEVPRYRIGPYGRRWPARAA